MQFVVSMNRLSAVAAKQRHNIIFSKRTAVLYIVLSVLLAALGNIPGLIQGLEINPIIMAAWFVTEPSYVNLWETLETGITCAIAAEVAFAYMTAFVIQK